MMRVVKLSTIRYYENVIASIQYASNDTIPFVSNFHCNKHNVPGWNGFAQEKHTIASCGEHTLPPE